MTAHTPMTDANRCRFPPHMYHTHAVDIVKTRFSKVIWEQTMSNSPFVTMGPPIFAPKITLPWNDPQTDYLPQPSVCWFTVVCTVWRRCTCRSTSSASRTRTVVVSGRHRHHFWLSDEQDSVPSATMPSQ